MYCVCGIFKNEAPVLQEWCQHYFAEGASRIFLINNGSTDNWRTKVSAFGDRVKVFSDNSKFSRENNPQIRLYNKYFLDRSKKYKWALVVDLDEFLYARSGTIEEYLRGVPDGVSQVTVPWTMFGSSGLEKQPDSIINNFIYRKRQRVERRGKAFARTCALKRFLVHKHLTKRGRKLVLDHTNNNLQLNHYRSQSKEYWRSRIKKGGINKRLAKKKDNWKFFHKMDYNGVKDTELRDKKMRNKKSNK